uniref:Mitotic spindle assembly checkpoint protein MAD1 n=1 Tax=Panagrolaimus sp. JU765 TaxID=591449 RepID=A0AC34QDT1_9BILA
RELRVGQQEAFDKYQKCKRELDVLKAEVERLREVEREYTAKNSSTKFLLMNYKTALSKYLTWFSHERKQTKVMKEILVNIGKWNADNRYHIYFAYKSDPPAVVTDDDVETLAHGSVLEYRGIDDIDNISNAVASTKYFSVATQTDGMFNTSASDGSLNVTSDSVQSNRGNFSLSSIKVTESETQFLDLRERLKKMEQENLNLKDQVMKEKEENDTFLRKILKLEEEMKQLKMSQKSMEEMKQDDSRSSTLLNDQTVPEPSVLLCHWKDNPYSLAVKEYEEKEAKRRKLDNTQIDGQKYYDALQQIEKLQKEIKVVNEQKERQANFNAESARKYRECMRLLTGYDVKMRNGEYIEVSSVYDPTNQFCFQKIGKEINVLDNQYARTWRQTMERYLPGSLPSFTAAVTIELYKNQHANNND